MVAFAGTASISCYPAATNSTNTSTALSAGLQAMKLPVTTLITAPLLTQSLKTIEMMLKLLLTFLRHHTG
jgi:hypothetical protein